MPDGLAWIADAWRGTSPSAIDLYITCARGLSPQQLAERMADHEPAEFGPALTVQDAHRMVDLTQIYCVGRIGQSGDWSFIVECVGSEGWALDPATSRGAEVLVFDPQPDNPPSFSGTSPTASCSCTSSWASATTPQEPSPTCWVRTRSRHLPKRSAGC
ncbi:hypothetical protein OHQ89_09280 [Streptomyces canus]|uniref:hypothetical protein n=1 Tax=Streptomyces canus TaxID=58343 RepID=UPI0030E2518D